MAYVGTFAPAMPTGHFPSFLPPITNAAGLQSGRATKWLARFPRMNHARGQRTACRSTGESEALRSVASASAGRLGALPARGHADAGTARLGRPRLSQVGLPDRERTVLAAGGAASTPEGTHETIEGRRPR